MRRCVTDLYSSQHVVWDTSAHFTDEFLESSRAIISYQFTALIELCVKHCRCRQERKGNLEMLLPVSKGRGRGSTESWEPAA